MTSTDAATPETAGKKFFSKQKSQNNANDPDRFQYGVLLRGKFIGVEDVKQETGDEVCQTSMIKLKALVLAKREHKQRICIKLNLDGVEILDEKTNQSLYKHSVNRISYIARDINDARAIGYIYKNVDTSYQYFAIKTERPAHELFNTLKDLFEVVLALRNAKKKKEAEGETKPAEEPASNETVEETPKELTEEQKLVTEMAAQNDEVIANLEQKIQQMKDQPAVDNDLVQQQLQNSSFEDSLQQPEQKTEEPKSASSDLFGLFTSDPAPTTTNTISNDLSNLTLDLGINDPKPEDKYASFSSVSVNPIAQPPVTAPRSAPLPPMGMGFGQPVNQFQGNQFQGIQFPQQQPQMFAQTINSNPFGAPTANFGAMPGGYQMMRPPMGVMMPPQQPMPGLGIQQMPMQQQQQQQPGFNTYFNK